MLSGKVFWRIVVVLIITVLFAGCASMSNLPVTESFPPKPDKTIVLVGTGEAFRFSDGSWIKAPSYNYEFTVVQRRYGDRWESVKEIHRRHPQYDGKAGDRDQTHYFVVRFMSRRNDVIKFSVVSSMGRGSGKADPGFRNMVVELRPEGISRFAPFNTYRITQHYQYREGKLNELVELFRKKDGSEYPFMKMEEKADIFMHGKLPDSPGMVK
ncbi:hypothetical protein BMS3Abin07_01201 [bacterium BMS3Abin07]|nr:hypothetical protein BMS3Abin07_01201 [bacterium BMS3Abin07]GBE31525.1 hypothetical protein BMS3Bbin05_00426 [bacterium BMS3Bbin05]